MWQIENPLIEAEECDHDDRGDQQDEQHPRILVLDRDDVQAVETLLTRLACFPRPVQMSTALPLGSAMHLPRQCLDHWVMTSAGLDRLPVGISTERDRMDVMTMDGSVALAAKEFSGSA